jgi:hypothetical protein
VKAFKDTLLLAGRNADALIADVQAYFMLSPPGHHLYPLWTA